MKLNITDLNLRFVSKRLALTDPEGNEVSQIVVKQLQIQKTYLNVGTGEESESAWEDVPEFTEDEVEEEISADEEETVDRIEGENQQQNSA